MGDELDLAIEYFNPVNARRRYEEEGYDEETIEALLVLDAMIYNADRDEVIAALRERGEYADDRPAGDQSTTV